MVRFSDTVRRIGIESRVGIGFDRHRSTNAVRNKVVYMNEGVKKTFLHATIPIPKLIRKMVQSAPEEDRVIFDHSNPDYPFLHRSASLIAVNIPSFSSGLDLWKNANRLGLKCSAKGWKGSVGVICCYSVCSYSR